MKRWTIILATGTVALYLCSLTALAQHGAGGHGGGGGHSATADGHGHGNSDTSSGGGGKSSGAETKQLNKFFTKKDSKLYSNISALATKDGTSITALQGMGFKNLGRMIAALHVYDNLGLASKTPLVSFTDFAKAATTGSLGKAIKQYDPTTNSSSEAKRGTKQAQDDMKENS